MGEDSEKKTKELLKRKFHVVSSGQYNFLQNVNYVYEAEIDFLKLKQAEKKLK